MIPNAPPERPQVDVPLAELVLYGNNPRTHTPEQLNKAIASYREFGWTNPILIDEHNVIIAGELRYKLAEALMLETVPCRRISDLSDAQKRALRIADNRIPLDAGWDDKKLQAEIEALAAEDFNLASLGFEDDELAALLSSTSLGNPDETPDTPDSPVSVLGDAWRCGKHVVVCGDSTNAETVKIALSGCDVKLMVTDPPYGVSYEPKWREEKGQTAAGTGIILNDDRSDWSAAWALFPGQVCYVWHGGLFSGPVQDSLTKSGFITRAQIIWVKSYNILSRGHYHWKHEAAWVAEKETPLDATKRLLRAALNGATSGEPLPDDLIEQAYQALEQEVSDDHENALYAVRKGAKSEWAGDRKQNTVWEIEHLKSGTGHASQKPVDCMKRPIENNSKAGGTVYDPFLGSGTTMVAAEVSARACRGIELNPSYVDVAVLRWEMLTGKRAIHIASGLTIDEMARERKVPMPSRVALSEKPNR